MCETFTFSDSVWLKMLPYYCMSDLCVVSVSLFCLYRVSLIVLLYDWLLLPPVWGALVLPGV